MTVSNYKTTASQNTAINGVNISEGMSPSDVNNAIRQELKDVRDVWNDKEWFLVGSGTSTVTYTRASATSVTINADVTSAYHVGRRIKITGTNTGTIYGKIATSSYSSPNTTVAFTFDSGTINASDSTCSVFVGSTYVGPSIPVIDEDAMGSNSAILPPSQQSVKAFVESGTSTFTNKRLNSPKINEDVVMSATSTELNIMDGVTSTTAELNILDGVTANAGEINILDGVTATTAELNIMDGVTSTTAELNYTDGVTSNIQTQLDAKGASSANLTAIGNLAKTDGNLIVGNGSTWVAENGGTARTSLGLGTISTQASNSVSISGGSITGMGTPSNNTDVSNKSYVDQAIAGLRNRTVAECASTANVNISNALEAGDAIDGVTLVSGDRVLLKNQSTATENGLYLAVGSGAGTASRDPEHDSISELSGGMIVVNQGSVNDNKIFLCTTDSDGSIGSTNITYTQVTPSNSGTVESIATGTGIDGGTITTTGTISIDSTVVSTLSGTQTLTNKTLTSPVISEVVSVSNGNISVLPNGSGKVLLDGNGSSGGISVSDGLIDIRTGTGVVSKVKFYCESSNAHAQTLQAQPHSSGSSSVSTLPTATGTLIGTGDTGTLPIVALDIDGGTDIGANIVDADLFIIDDGAGGTNKKTTASRLKTYIGSGTTINNNANNKVITGSGTANTLEAEARLLYDNDALTQQANGSSTEFRQTSDGGGTYWSSLTASASEVKLYTRTASPLYLGTNNGTRIIVNHTNGSLALGASWDTWYRMQMRFNGNGGGGIVLDNSETDTNGTMYINFKQGNSAIGYIARNGTTSAVSYSTSSDYRLKDNVSYDFDATTKLKQLKPARFSWKSDPSSKIVDGFLAHEVSSIVPEAITGTKDETETKEKVVISSDGKITAEWIEETDWIKGKSDEVLYIEEDKEVIDGLKNVGDIKTEATYKSDTTWEATKVISKYQGIDQSKLVPLLVKTIQELEARITTLENA